jgi:hypothetical protein
MDRLAWARVETTRGHAKWHKKAWPPVSLCLQRGIKNTHASIQPISKHRDGSLPTGCLHWHVRGVLRESAGPAKHLPGPKQTPVHCFVKVYNNNKGPLRLNNDSCFLRDGNRE